jgi:hypothetical protein
MDWIHVLRHLVCFFHWPLMYAVAPNRFLFLGSGRHQWRHGFSQFAWFISLQAVIIFSHNQPVTSKQPAILFSQNKSAPAINHQPNEHAYSLVHCNSRASRVQNFAQHVQQEEDSKINDRLNISSL